MFEPWQYVAIAGIGLFAGALGGMLGVGGGVIMLPGLVFLFGQDQTTGLNQHIYHAASMGTSALLSISATWRHYKAGALVPRAIQQILPWAIGFMVLGVWLSNLPIFEKGVGQTSGPVMLQRVVALFLIYVIVSNTRKLFHKPRPVEGEVDLTRVTAPRCAAVGIGTGTVAGLTGLAGGVMAIPLQQLLLNLKLRNCIANSAFLICFIGLVGATFKNVTLTQHGLDYTHSLLLTAILAPTAILGGYCGAGMTHVMPIRVVRVFFILIMSAAAWKMAGI